MYEADKKQRIKESTWESKSHVIRTKILPYFENRKIAEIEAKDVIAWQNELMAYWDEKGKPYSADYLRTIHAQLTAINVDGRKEVLTIVIGENESSKHWLGVLNGLKNRGVKDILILCSDSLSGIKEAVSAALYRPHGEEYIKICSQQRHEGVCKGPENDLYGG